MTIFFFLTIIYELRGIASQSADVIPIGTSIYVGRDVTAIKKGCKACSNFGIKRETCSSFSFLLHIHYFSLFSFDRKHIFRV